MAYLEAIDVSLWQGEINWGQVPQPIAIIKMSGGDAGLYFDSKANQNYYAAKAAGKAVGCYHFAGGGNAAAEADFFVKACSPLEQNDVLALDWEVQHADPVGWCNTFVNRVHELTGVWPLIYINLATLRAHNWDVVLANCGLWLAAWNNDPDGAALTTKTYVMHQYTSDGSVPGIAGRVDMDAWYGTLAQFQEYGYQVATPEPTPPQPIPQPEPVPTPEPTPQPVPVPTPPVIPPVISAKNQEQDARLTALEATLKAITDFLNKIFKWRRV